MISKAPDTVSPFSVFFLLFLVVPFIEIYFLIEVGGIIGAGWTIVLVVLTAVIGAALIRQQRFSTLFRIQQKMAENQLPAIELLEGILLLVAGALLMTPGFFTDALGFICLTPPLRRLIITFALKRGLLKATGFETTNGRSQPRAGQPLDGDYRNIDE